MNNKFKLQNFRVFDAKGAEFEIAPITILTGCNSSGKSSTIKSLMLLKQYFSTLKEDYSNGRPIKISDHELLFNKGKHNLGTFEKTLSKHVKKGKDSPKMTFTWTKYSHLMLKDLRIEVNFIENHKNIFNNAVLKDIRIFLAKKEIVFLDFTDEFDFRIDYQLFKSDYFQFLALVKIYDDINGPLGFNKSVGTPNLFKNEKDLFNHVGSSRFALDSVVYADQKLIKSDDINLLVSKCREIPKEAIDHKTLLYLPILDWLKDVPKSEVPNVLWDKAEKSEVEGIKEFLTTDLTELLKEFHASEYSKFSEFYIENIENKLTKCFCLKNDKELADTNKYLFDKDRLLKETNWQWQNSPMRGEEKTLFNFRKWMVGGKGKEFLSEMESFLSLDSPLSQQFYFDFIKWSKIDKSQAPKAYDDFMLLAAFCLTIDKDFEIERIKDIDFQPIAPPVQYFESKEYNTSITFILAVIQDMVYNVPSFIENIEFVEAVRANVQRIYAFNQNNDFTELILNYLNTTSRDQIPGKETNKKGFRFKRIEEDGHQIFEISEDEEEGKNVEKKKSHNGYELGSFMRKWLQMFEIADDIIFENTSEGLGVLIYLVKGNTKELLADQGYGITQLLAIMLKIETLILKSENTHTQPLTFNQGAANHESTISIEEPETNLHPMFQSKLAEMFMDAYKTYNIRFIVETHSEYLIRKLQTLVAKKELKPDEVSLHYIYHHDKSKRPAGKPQVLKINIREDGRLNEPFGSGFFDEADNLAMDLLTLKTLN